MIEHILDGLLPRGARLPDEAPSLARQLGELIGKPLHVDLRELRALDEFLLSQYHRKGDAAFDDFLAPRFFEPLVAFVGEVLKKATRGEWLMVPRPRFSIWEPWIVSPEKGSEP